MNTSKIKLKYVKHLLLVQFHCPHWLKKLKKNVSLTHLHKKILKMLIFSLGILLILPVQLGHCRLTASCLLEQRGRTCCDKVPASCCPQHEENDGHGGAFFSSVVSFSWAANCSLAVAPATHEWPCFVRQWGTGAVCVSPPPQPGLELELGRQQSLTPAQGLNQQHWSGSTSFSLF